MARFRIFGAVAERVHHWGTFGDYEVRHDGEHAIRLRYDPEVRGPFDAATTPYRVVLGIEDGEIVTARYYDPDKRVMAEITGLDVDADSVRAQLDSAVGRGAIYDLLVDGGVHFRGGRQDDDRWDHHDQIVTGRGDDRVHAHSGNDQIRDRGGADFYDGDGGRDVVSYEAWYWRDAGKMRSGVELDLMKKRAVGPDGQVDELRSIEGARGTFLDDVLKGDRDENHFRGLAGDDVIDGRRGFDLVAHDADHWQGGGLGIIAHLRKGYVRDGFGDRDAIHRIEGVRGTAKRDRFYDDEGDNVFLGDAGRDRLSFGRGDDVGTGGAGADRFVFRDEDFGRDRVTDFDGAEGDRIRIKRADDLGDVTIRTEGDDTLIAFEGELVILEDYRGEVGTYLLF